MRKEIKRNLDVLRDGTIIISPRNSHADILRHVVDDVGYNKTYSLLEELEDEDKRQEGRGYRSRRRS